MEASTSSEVEAPGVSDLDSYSESEDSQLSLQEDPTLSVSVRNLLDRLKCRKSSVISAVSAVQESSHAEKNRNLTSGRCLHGKT